jgi:hypothetical protein
MAAKKPAAPASGDSADVDAYMRALDHPRKAEIEAVRRIILGANPKMAERVKWNAPSFFHVKDFAAFNPRNAKVAQLVIVFHDGWMIDERDGLLEGDYKDRRLAHFADMADVNAKREALVRVVNRWIARVGG